MIDANPHVRREQMRLAKARADELRIRIDEAVLNLYGKPIDGPPSTHEETPGRWFAFVTMDYGQTGVTSGDGHDEWCGSEVGALERLLGRVRSHVEAD